jgi:hypothetical protein
VRFRFELGDAISAARARSNALFASGWEPLLQEKFGHPAIRPGDNIYEDPLVSRGHPLNRFHFIICLPATQPAIHPGAFSALQEKVYFIQCWIAVMRGKIFAFQIVK